MNDTCHICGESDNLVPVTIKDETIFLCPECKEAHLTMKHCFRLHFITPRQAAQAPQYEASPFHSDMKHFAYAPYDVRKWKMRVYPFVIRQCPYYIIIRKE